jgi:hypothetical protein
MIGFMLALVRPRAHVQCFVCGWNAPRSRMWRNCPGVYVCRSEGLCGWRYRQNGEINCGERLPWERREGSSS